MKTWKTYENFLKTNPFLICLTFLLCFGITAMSYGQTIVSIDPVEVASPAAGGTLSVHIKITNGTGVAGYDVTVGFDTSALRYVEFQNANYLPVSAFAAPPQVSGNLVTLAAIALSGTASAKSGTLATLTFEVVAAKASTIELVEVILSDSDANELPVTKRNGEVVVAAFLATDLNKDGSVNVLDLTLVARDLGEMGSPASDVTGDGSVNVLDLVRVAQDLGKTTTGGGGAPTDGGGTTAPQPDPYQNGEPDNAKTTFDQNLLPILTARCAYSGCHDANGPYNLDFRTYQTFIRSAEDEDVFVPGNARSSDIIEEIVSGRMPPGGPPLTAAQIQLFRDWINQQDPADFPNLRYEDDDYEDDDYEEDYEDDDEDEDDYDDDYDDDDEDEDDYDDDDDDDDDEDDDD